MNCAFSRLAAGVWLVLLLGACTVGPNYGRVHSAVPAHWGEMPGSGLTAGPVRLARWWTLFEDRELDSLMERAVASNLDLRDAEARIREARAQRRVIAADAFPAVGVQASYARERSSENAGAGADSDVSSRVLKERNLFQAGFDASWEVDLFGRVRRAVEAANADIGASIEDRRDVLVTLLAEVARNYFEVRGYQRRIVVARENQKLQEQTVQLTRGRLQAGLGNELDVAQGESLLASIEAQVPSLQTAVRQGIHRLGVLLGREPEALLGELSKVRPIPFGPPEVPVGLPSGLLQRRPDVRRAERQLAAATARVGVATADLFPRFSLTGLVGMQSADITDLAVPGSRFWTIGPFVSWPIFDSGRIRARIRVQDARQEQAWIGYQRTVLTALEDVENALVAYAKEHRTRRALMRAVAANRRAVDISGELYSKGLVDFLNVLDSQRSRYLSEDQLIQSNLRIATDLVALFKSLGGGWELPQQDRALEP